MNEVKIGNQVRYIVDTDVVTLAQQSPGQVMETRKAAAHVSIPVGVLKSLRDSGHFLVEHMPRHKRGFHERDLDNFQRRLLDCNTPAGRADTSKESLVSLAHILQEMPFWSKTGKAEFVAANLDGVIQATCRTGDSWQDILFHETDVAAYAGNCRKRASGGALSQQDAAKILGCSRQAIPGLINAGHLIGCPGPGRTRVDRQSLEKFSACYVFLAAIAKQLETSVTRLIRLCRQAGLETLGISRKWGEDVLFIRSESKAVLIEQARLNPSNLRQRAANPVIISRTVKLKRYLDDLRQNDTPLPRRAKLPNKRAIANACGIDRNFLYLNAETVAMLDAFDAEDRERYQLRTREEPVTLVRRYIEQVKETGIHLPRRAGRLNRLAIAKACGFNRNILYSDSEAMALLEAIDAEFHRAYSD